MYSLRDTSNQHQVLINRMVQYGTDTVRAQTNPQAVPDGALFVIESSGVIWQARLATQQTTRQWFEIPSGGGTVGPPGPQGPPGPPGPQGPPGQGAGGFSPVMNDVTGQRFNGQIYTNPNGVFMLVTVTVPNIQQAESAAAYINNSILVSQIAPSSTGPLGTVTLNGSLFFPVPAGASYTVITSVVPTVWIEWY
jgi:hypothetical protein